MKAIKNMKLITENGVVENQGVIFDQRIQEIVAENQIGPGMEVIDVGGAYLSAGFIDIHIHGCAGYDVMDDDDHAIRNIARHLVTKGVTAFLPTTMTMEFSRIKRALERIRKNMTDSAKYAQVLGCNLEGPFLSKKYKGAQDEKYIRQPDFELISPYLDVIRLLTIAPEEEGSIDFIKQAVQSGIVVSIGHTNATFNETTKGIEAGASHVTHLFNGMTPLHHRNPGVVGAALWHDVTCELIADNIHVDPAVQTILLKVKGEEKIILITDAMRACLLADGEYDLGGQKVYVKDHQAKLSNGSLAGSTLVLNEAIRNFMTNTGMKIEDAVKMTTLNPAKLLGIEKQKGSVTPGKDADLVVFDQNLNIMMTIIGGETVFTMA